MRTERYTRTLDELETDLIVTTLFQTERPPQGVSGLLDWRLNGFVSRQIINRVVVGKADEQVLIPLHRRLPARRLIVVGLGQPSEFRLADARHSAHKLGRALEGLQAVDVALSYPNAVDEKIPGETERTVLDTLAQCQLQRQLVVRWLAPAAPAPKADA